jgi:hypothetical protein
MKTGLGAGFEVSALVSLEESRKALSTAGECAASLTIIRGASTGSLGACYSELSYPRDGDKSLPCLVDCWWLFRRDRGAEIFLVLVAVHLEAAPPLTDNAEAGAETQMLKIGADAEKKEFLADVSFFGDASGGHLILVNLQGTSKSYSRNSAGKYPLDVGELPSAYLRLFPGC